MPYSISWECLRQISEIESKNLYRYPHERFRMRNLLSDLCYAGIVVRLPGSDSPNDTAPLAMALIIFLKL